MKLETQRRLEYLMYGLEVTLTAIEQLTQDGYYAKEIKHFGNKLYEAIQTKYNKGFKQSTTYKSFFKRFIKTITTNR